MMPRKVTIAAALTAAVTTAGLLGAVQPVLAFFATQVAVATTTIASALSVGATPTTAVSGRDIAVSWSASALAGSSPAVTSSSYTVTRFSSAAPTVAITPTNGCAGTLSVLTCTESGLAAGSWLYAITPGRSAWLGNRGTSSATATVGSAALSLSSSTLTTAGGTLTGTVSNYRDSQTVNFCFDQAPASACTSANRVGVATVPAAGGTVAATLTIASGTAAGSHTISAYGSLGDAATQTVTVSAAAIVGLEFTNTQVNGGSVTLNCGAVTAKRTCTGGVTGNNGDNRSFTFTITLVNASDKAVNNPGAVATVSFSQTGGQSTPASVTIASGSPSTATVTYSLSNGSGSGTIVASVTISGVTYTVTATVS